jgi:inner membrane protein
MDPLTQGVLGAALPLAVARRSEHMVAAGILGLLSGMAPDMDVLLRSSSDPLLFLEYHRQFTHSLIFIPFGGLLCCLLLYRIVAKPRGLSMLQCFAYCTLGYATHGLLDACTTYGTQLLWPFSHQRFAWNTMSIIDPLYTLPILLLVLMASLKRNPRIACIAMCWVLLYPLMGMVQRERAEQFGLQLAQQRGHVALQLEAKPSFGNLLLWKIVYQTEQDYYVDAVRIGFDSRHYQGTHIGKLNVAEDFPWLAADSQQRRDIERFRWFSNDYLAVDPKDADRIIDVRFSMVPNEIAGLWGIRVSADAGLKDHVSYEVNRDASAATRERFWRMLVGK